MTFEELDNVRYARKRVEVISKSIEELDNLLLPSKVGGVHSSTPSSPVEQHFRQKERLIASLEREMKTMMDLIEYVQAWCETCPVKIRNIVYLRYLQNKSWKYVARHLYGSFTEESVPYNVLKRYLTNNTK